ncbi:hypothetical protein [Paenarthrobacter aurescens]|jgi:hypothetical protein|uniref:Uncharacterized protein n=2 Tax=Paenarthrobacter aurescens TaxID=43663 RepID=Q6SK15_PAEAU|nr:hypothetical protein [Paenarthrobacter aurescens]AAS20157.1 hypothetical protein [Paenarthrobacter aurescens]ABM10422.1 hypothetical protein AAur_pTC10110 [Paenarthrobacter aurescens TC1]
MRKHWKALTAVGVMILIVAVAVILINRPAPATEQDPGSLQASGKFGFPVSDINIGEGGTTKASDDKTITGYNGTCDSAAQAAANYAPLLRDVNLKTWESQKKALGEVSKPGPWVASATLSGDILAGLEEEQPPGAFEGGWVQRADVAAGGMYRVASCEQERSAVVQVFIGSLDGRTNSVPLANYGTVSMELGWEGDWKITDAMPEADDPSFGGRVKDAGPSGQDPAGPTGEVPLLSNDLVEWVFKDASRQGWIEYANAKR